MTRRILIKADNKDSMNPRNQTDKIHFFLRKCEPIIFQHSFKSFRRTKRCKRHSFDLRREEKSTSSSAPIDLIIYFFHMKNRLS